MHVDSSSDHLFKIARHFGICISKNWVRDREYNKVAEMIKEGFDFKKKSHYDLILLLYDNAGFHIRMGKRRKVGYDQYTKLIWITDTANDLIELGAYPDLSKTSGAQQLLP
jgi:hypothetical protein